MSLCASILNWMKSPPQEEIRKTQIQKQMGRRTHLKLTSEQIFLIVNKGLTTLGSLELDKVVKVDKAPNHPKFFIRKEKEESKIWVWDQLIDKNPVRKMRNVLEITFNPSNAYSIKIKERRATIFSFAVDQPIKLCQKKLRADFFPLSAVPLSIMDLEYKNKLCLVDKGSRKKTLSEVLNKLRSGSLNWEVDCNCSSNPKPLNRYENQPIKNLPRRDVYSILFSLLQGLMVLHEKKLVHRVVDSNHICLFRHFDNSFEAYLTDSSMICPEGKVESRLAYHRLMDHLPPEMLESVFSGTEYKFSTKSDIWYLGIVAYNLWIGTFPHYLELIRTFLKKNKSTEIYIENLDMTKLIPAFIQAFQSFVKEDWTIPENGAGPLKGDFEPLLRKLLDPLPEKRPTAVEATLELLDIIKKERVEVKNAWFTWHRHQLSKLKDLVRKPLTYSQMYNVSETLTSLTSDVPLQSHCWTPMLHSSILERIMSIFYLQGSNQKVFSILGTCFQKKIVLLVVTDIIADTKWKKVHETIMIQCDLTNPLFFKAKPKALLMFKFDHPTYENIADDEIACRITHNDARILPRLKTKLGYNGRITLSLSKDLTYPTLVEEYFLEGDLEKVLSKHPETFKDESSYVQVLYQILKSLAYIHNKKCVHADLKFENILIRKKENKFIARVTDVGLLTEANSRVQFRGTAGWISPTVFKKNRQSGSIYQVYQYGYDMWAFGLIALAFRDLKTATTIVNTQDDIYKIHQKIGKLSQKNREKGLTDEEDMRYKELLIQEKKLEEDWDEVLKALFDGKWKKTYLAENSQADELAAWLGLILVESEEGRLSSQEALRQLTVYSEKKKISLVGL